MPLVVGRESLVTVAKREESCILVVQAMHLEVCAVVGKCVFVERVHAATIFANRVQSLCPFNLSRTSR